MEKALQDFMTFIIGIIGSIAGIAIGYGMLRQQTKVNTEEIAKIKDKLAIIEGTNPGATGLPPFIRRVECDDREIVISKDISELKNRLDLQHKSLKGLQNFARWTLTTKEGLGLAEVNKILNGD